MLYRKCACGCGKYFRVKSSHQKYYDENHKHKHYYDIEHGPEVVFNDDNFKIAEELTPCERWEIMTFAQLGAEERRLHKTYGQIQSMYYSGTLPEDYGLNVLNNRKDD